MGSDSESEEHSTQVRGIPGTIILINMYDPHKRKSSEKAHVATCQLVRHYLRTQCSQYLGVFLYGTDDDNTSIFAIKCLREIIPLSSPTLLDYKALENIKIDTIKKSKELVLSDVLAHCSKMFSACKKTLSIRTIIMLTALDEPPAAYDQDATLQTVFDLAASGIQLKIINVADSDYDIHQFYQDFLFEANKEQDVALPICVWDCEEIKKQMIIQSHRHLAIAELPFEICKDVKMGVKIYKLLKSQTEPKSVYLHKETNATVTSSTKTMKTFTQTDNDMDIDEDQETKSTQVPLLESERLQYQEYGGEKIEFSDTEINYMTNPFGANILKLIGFKPANVLQKEKWFIENCYFLFPSEEKIEGSTIAFKALYQACLEMEVVAICILRTRVNSRPRIVALSPSKQPFGFNINIGFDVIIIPFAENVRDLPVIEDNENVGISSEQKTNMNDIVGELIFDYNPEMFENPMLQSKYRVIEAKALEDQDLAEMLDTTKPNEEIFEQLDNDTFNKLFGPFGTLKRGNESKISSTVTKKAKVDYIIDQDKLRENITNKKVDKMYTIEQLKQILNNLNITGLPKKKGDLVKLVYESYK